ncbi:MAG TPA: hypothetical protein VF607_01140, partial [Verrucomicrobiae bacterium]
GLPDWWERLKGLNPNSAAGDFSDANADLAGDGYTELERYLNWLAKPHYEVNTNTTLNVDLTQYTRGFTNASLAATYGVLGNTNGTISLTGQTAQFTPTITSNGLGSFYFKVTDNTGFSYTNLVNVHILAQPANRAPVLAAVGNYTLNPGMVLNITNVASDADLPSQTLTYSLPVAPTNAVINGTTGVLSWRPWMTQADSTNAFLVMVSDNGTPSLSATQAFNVVVNPLAAPTTANAQINNGQLSFLVNGPGGPDYAVQGSTNLTTWTTLFQTNAPAVPFQWSDSNFQLSPAQFYRIKVGPPWP